MNYELESAISFQNVSKRFSVSREKPQSVLETLISVVNRRNRDPKGELWAVRDVSFDVYPGQSLGIVGRNGSGKSTVLKLMARILRPSAGQVTVRGRVSALLELGAGFHPDLTGRDNIALNASVLGLTEAEVEEKFDSIVAFSELGDFIDMPVKHYSSGMYMRLGFSVAIHVDPDILIVDEILAVGDQAFQIKCLDRIHQMKQHGVTVILISHNLQEVRRLCSHLIWLENGEVRSSGETDAVANDYQAYSEQKIGQQLSREQETLSFRRWGNRDIEIAGVRFLDGEGKEENVFNTGEPLTIEICYHAHKPVRDPEFGLAIYRQDGVHVIGPNSRLGAMETGVVEGPGVVRYQIPHLPLLPARYQVTTAIHDSRIALAYDFHERAYAFRVVRDGGAETEGLVDMAASWQWEPDSR